MASDDNQATGADDAASANTEGAASAEVDHASSVSSTEAQSTAGVDDAAGLSADASPKEASAADAGETAGDGGEGGSVVAGEAAAADAAGAGGAAGDGAEGGSVVAGEAAAADAAAPDEAPAVAEQSDAAPAEGEPADAAAASESEASKEPGSEAGKKKRRRRRRKRKPGAADGKGDESADASQAGEADDAKPSEGRRKSARPERPAFSPGDQVFGKICRVTEQALWIDIAGKATGLFDVHSVTGDVPKEGEQFIAKVQSSSTRGGMVMLVSEPAKPGDTKAELRAALDSGEAVEGWVTGVIKGGVEVDFKGVRAFAPASHVELRPSSDLSHLLGQRLPFIVTHYAKKGRDIVVSRKAHLEQNAEKERGEQLAKIEPDLMCKGIVRKVLGWGAFVSLPEYGHIEGVVHMTEVSHDRGAKLGDVLKVGQQVEVKVLRVDEKGKLWLSRKGAQQDPWGEVKAKYPPRSQHRGKVVRLTDFGAFVQLEPGVDGLCHVSDLSVLPIEHPKDAVAVGEEMDVVVSHLDAGGRKIGLHPAPPEDEREVKGGRLQAYQIVNAVVVQIRDNGVVVRIVGQTGRAQRAFLPASQTGTPRGTDLRKEFPLGKQFEAKVLEVDQRRGEARLSIRAVKDDAEKKAYREYRKQVQREAHFGTFADLLKKS